MWLIEIVGDRICGVIIFFNSFAGVVGGGCGLRTDGVVEEEFLDQLIHHFFFSQKFCLTQENYKAIQL